MNFGYQKDDKDLFNYDLFELEKNIFCRGPKPDFSKKYFCCIGGAQTFGRFCHQPYCNLISKKIKIQCLNLGFAGVGPEFFNNKFKNLISGSEFCLVQFFSGRSASNNLFLNEQGINYGFDLIRNKQTTPYEFWEYILKNKTKNEIDDLVYQTRESYIYSFINLLKSIKKRKILLWFSRRKPSDYNKNYSTNPSFFWNSFPQFVNQDTVEKIKPHADQYVEAVLNDKPEKLEIKIKNSFFDEYFENSKKVFFESNNYYPTSKMHYYAYKKLMSNICKIY